MGDSSTASDVPGFEEKYKTFVCNRMARRAETAGMKTVGFFKTNV
jgi:hypothetical protein